MNPFDKDFWLNPYYRNIRKSIYSFLSPIDHLHIYGHRVYNTCAECYKTVLSNNTSQCRQCRYVDECGGSVYLLYCSDHSYKFGGIFTHTCKKHRLI